VAFIDVLVEDSPECAGCARRWKAESAPRRVTWVRFDDALYDVDAMAVEVEDSGSGTSILVYGGDRGVRLTPRAGGPAIVEPFLLLAAEEVEPAGSGSG
jgi:hypothetical protein